MTKGQYENAMFKAQIESQKIVNEKLKAELRLLEVDFKLKQAQLKKLLGEK